MTEATYVRNLQLVVEVFYTSLLPMLSMKETTVIFANIEDLLLVNTVSYPSSSRLDKHHLQANLQTFLSSLEERQKACRLYVDNVGDLLVNHMTNMAAYLVRIFCYVFFM